jgi:maleylacetoacetate isomerase
MQLYNYFRSSAGYRTRIALNLKSIEYEYIAVHLVKGEQRDARYLTVNPYALVPALSDHHGTHVQSLAIIEYLDECHPAPPLLPATPIERVRVRAIALAIACDIHPLNNLRVLQYLKHSLEASDAERDAWYRHWIVRGFDALETQLATDGGAGLCCHGDTPTLADICLVPQVFNARRSNVPLDAYPTIARIDAHCRTLDAFAAAAPERQPDAT